ncbi:MAG: YidC/Oxa1 family membrane protein insertase [Lachnospiraceae bacterium]|nr:YidC/Oxa1 family membrane protein insertase [Lachnospiraceae bacterium]
MMDVILTTYQGSILGPIARLLGQILEWLYVFMSRFGIENVGVCMIAFTFLVNLLMLPLVLKQQKFAKMSSIMNPEIMAIQEKYKGKRDQASQQKMSMETQAVYQKYGVSPASGCLPMLITFPILFALYRVIYNIPAYVKPIHNMYTNVAQSVRNLGISVEDLSQMTNSKTYVIQNAVKADSADLNYYIDILGQFNQEAWDKLASTCNAKGFASIADLVDQVSGQAYHINSFLGLNIADLPVVPFIGGAALTASVLIPILSVITQMISMKLSMASTPQPQDTENTAMASMNTMNKVMPFVTGVMCFMFPIGVGIYWVAGNVFRILQTIVINAYFKRLDMDDLIAKNVEKAKKRFEKLGIDPNTAFADVSKQRTSNIDKSKTKTSQSATRKKVNRPKKSLADKDFKRPETNKKYKEGSVAHYANMLARDNDGK